MKKILTCFLAVLMLTTLTVPALAASNDFVPSIEIKPAPGIVVQPTEDGEPAYGYIIMPDGTVIPLPEGAVVITPISKADEAEDHIKDALDESYSDIQNAEDLSDLIDSLQDVLDQIADGVDVDDLVITDLFHVDLIGTYKEYLEAGGKLKLTFEVGQDIIAALADVDGAWSALFGDNFVDNGNGTFTLTMDDVGVYAFFKDVASVDVDPEDPGVSSPTTGDMTTGFLVLAVVFVGAAVALLIAYKKQKA